MRTGKTLLLAAFCLASALQFASATQIEYRSPRQLGVESETVVFGRVETVESRWNPQRTKIFTEAVISVEETFKGQALPVVRVTQLGGVVGNVRMEVAGSLPWRAGEEVLVFLERVPSGALTVAGFTQGKFAVERDPRTGRATVRQATVDGVDILGAPGATAGTAPRVEAIPLNRFVDQALGRR